MWAKQYLVCIFSSSVLSFPPFLSSFPTMTAVKMNYGAALKKDMYERKDTSTMVEAAVSKDGLLLANVKHQTPRITWLAVSQNWRALQFVQEINTSLVRNAVYQSSEAGALVPVDFHLTAVIANINSFDFLRRPSMEACQYVLKEKPDWITKFKNPPVELCLQVVKLRHHDACRMAACTIPNSNDRYLGVGYLEGMHVSDELVRQALPATHGLVWRSLPPALQSRYDLHALRINGAVLRYMEQTPARQKAVVEGFPWALRGFEQTPELVEIACKKNPMVLEIVKNPSRDLVMKCAEDWYGALQFAAEQDAELCMHAVLFDIRALQYVRKNPLQIWAQCGTTRVPDLRWLFPQHRKYITMYGHAHDFFLRIALQCRDNLTVPAEEMEDPITLASVEAGTLVAVIEENGKQHFAGTWESLWGMMKTGFRGSNYGRIFVPIKNALVHTSQIQWRLAA